MPTCPPSEYVALPDFAVLQCQGDDAVTFLHNQLSNDLHNLPQDQACLAAYCSAKGRVLANLVVWRTPAEGGDTCYALVKADLAPTLVKRLSMFVLRAKVQVSLAPWAVHAQTTAASPKTSAPWAVWSNAQGVHIQAPSAHPDQCRVWHLCPPTAALDTPLAPDSQAEAWRAADIAAGLPWIDAANQDTYIPQTLNLDLIGAINFSKGCYPGQEVVARSHYRGTIKRRMAYGTAPLNTPTQIGTDIFKVTQPNPCGRVINLATTTEQHLLLEIQLADLPDADFRLGDPAGASIHLHPLPYAIMPNATP